LTAFVSTQLSNCSVPLIGTSLVEALGKTTADVALVEGDGWI